MMNRHVTPVPARRPVLRLGLICSVLVLHGCALKPTLLPSTRTPIKSAENAAITPATRITRDLVRLPAPRFRIPVAVYAFRDQTGQFKPQPDSNLSTSVTQGAASILVKALLDSGWYLPIEREGFQNLLNERRVARAIETPADKGKAGSSFPQLVSANYIIEGGVIGYEQNVRTGGDGANLLGIGGNTSYRMDQVTVNLRSVDVRSGQVVNSVSVTKTIYSYAVDANIYKFIAYKTLLQAESGFTSNEPSHMAVKEAIESAVIHLTVQGIRDRAWQLRDEQDWASPLVQTYIREAENEFLDPSVARSAEIVPMRPTSLVLPTPELLGVPANGALPVTKAPALEPPRPVSVAPAAPPAPALPVLPTPSAPAAPPVPVAAEQRRETLPEAASKTRVESRADTPPVIDRRVEADTTPVLPLPRSSAPASSPALASIAVPSPAQESAPSQPAMAPPDRLMAWNDPGRVAGRVAPVNVPVPSESLVFARVATGAPRSRPMPEGPEVAPAGADVLLADEAAQRAADTVMAGHP